MAVPSSAFPKASFAGIPFLYTEVRVKGGLRNASHEFPHAPGEEFEKLGRKAYRVSFKALFHDIPGSAMNANYPDAYPVNIRKLREIFELGKTEDLVIPTIGTIKAFAPDWEQTFRTAVLTGETMDMEFLEDQDAATLVGLVTEFGSPQAVFVANDNLQALAAIADFKSVETAGVMQRINDAVVAVEGVFGRADAASQIVAAKIQQVTTLCQYADAQLSDFQDPMNYEVITAMKDLYLSSRDLAENVTQSQAELRSKTTPKLMSIQQVSQWLFGATDRAAEILQLNAFEDAFAIPAGTTVKYVAA